MSLPDLAAQLITALQPGSTADTQLAAALAKRVRTGGGPRQEWVDVRAALRRRARAARVRVEDDMADALDRALGVLETHRARGWGEWDESLPLQTSNLSTHVQLLLNLSTKPTERTHELATAYLVRPPRSKKNTDLRLFRTIMAEPFAGAHWGPSYEPEQDWEPSSSSSSSSLSEDEDDEVVTPLSVTMDLSRMRRERERAERRREEEERTGAARQRLEEARRGAYWDTGGKVVPPVKGLHGWKAISTVSTVCALEGQTKAITAQHLQRELLFALTGRPGVFFAFLDGTCFVVHPHPAVTAFSRTALDGLLDWFARVAAHAAALRAFVDATTSDRKNDAAPHRPQERVSRTQEAFAEACRRVLEDLGHWVADLETDFLRGTNSEDAPAASATPLVLKRELELTRTPVLESLQSFLPLAPNPTTLLNAIYAFLPAYPSLGAIFLTAAEPTWAMLGAWLTRGMPVPDALRHDADVLTVDVGGAGELGADAFADGERAVPHEFWVKRDRDVGWADEEFWDEGFVQAEPGPQWIDAETRKLVLEAGKARGLLKSLTDEGGDEPSWPRLATVIEAFMDAHSGSQSMRYRPISDEVRDQAQARRSTPTPQDIADAVCAHIEPVARLAQVTLRRILDDECGLRAHLDAIEGVLLFRAEGFAVVDAWAGWLFAQMRAVKPWADFQLLTSRLRDAIDTDGQNWMNAPAVRARVARRPGRAPSLFDLRVDYEVPFPLSQLFSPTSMAYRSDVFTFLVGLLRVRKALVASRTLDGDYAVARPSVEARALWMLRQRLSWVVDTVWVWVNERVIEVEVGRYHEALSSKSALSDMIELELEHTRRLRDFCLLHEKTHALKDALDEICTLVLSFYDTHLAHAAAGGQAAPALLRSRRRRRRHPGSDSDSDGHGYGELDSHAASTRPGPGPSAASSPAAVPPPNPPLDPRRFLGVGRPTRADLHDTSTASARTDASGADDEDVAARVGRLGTELGRHVRRLRRGAEALASAEEDATWGMLAFALEDWRD
ncbi:hypothetical protein Q5752_005690 [Cryptotrichosporon argae]